MHVTRPLVVVRLPPLHTTWASGFWHSGRARSVDNAYIVVCAADLHIRMSGSAENAYTHESRQNGSHCVLFSCVACPACLHGTYQRVLVDCNHKTQHRPYGRCCVFHLGCFGGFRNRQHSIRSDRSQCEALNPLHGQLPSYLSCRSASEVLQQSERQKQLLLLPFQQE